MRDSTIAIRETPFDSPMTWAADTLLPGDGLISLDDAVVAELLTLCDDPNFTSVPATSLHPDAFYLPLCRELMQQIRHLLDVQTGFAIIDRMPLEALGEDAAIRAYWLLMNMIGQTVAQKWDGTNLYEVTDTRQETDSGNGVRSSKTREGQRYHTDNAFNVAPEYVGLLCLRTALEGGISGLVSFETLYNRLLSERPDVLPRLYQPFYFDRQLEHGEHEERVSYKPMLENRDGSIAFNFNPRLVEQGYIVKGETIDADAVAALAALRDLTEADGMGKTFAFSPGQIQIVNNRRIGHRRTAYVDHPEAENRRRLIRIWVRNFGSTCYAG